MCHYDFTFLFLKTLDVLAIVGGIFIEFDDSTHFRKICMIIHYA